MPDARLQRTRETLPEGYQFGDAGRDRVPCRFDMIYGVVDFDPDAGLFERFKAANPELGPNEESAWWAWAREQYVNPAMIALGARYKSNLHRVDPSAHTRERS